MQTWTNRFAALQAQVSALAFPTGVPAAAADPFGDTATQPFIKNSLGQNVSVVYEALYHALHLDVPGPTGDIISSAYIAGTLLQGSRAVC